MTTIALGFRVKSGFAIAVALEGPAARPVPLGRWVVALSDPRVEETKQPYHDGFGTAQEDLNVIARLTRIIERSAASSVAQLLAHDVFVGRACRRAGLVVGSVIDPATVANPHIRAHASEGRVFRSVLESALGTRGITASIVVEKTLADEAARALKRPQREITKTVAGFGAALPGPWRAEEKAAATAAWMVLP
jgi:hypothetical protein